MDKIVKNILEKMGYKGSSLETKIEEVLTKPYVNMYNSKLDTSDKSITMEFGINTINLKKERINSRNKIPKELYKNKFIDYKDYLAIGDSYIWDNLNILTKEKGKRVVETPNYSNYIIDNIEIKYHCPKCNGYLISKSAQTRGLDEDETVMYICTQNPSHVFKPQDIEGK